METRNIKRNLKYFFNEEDQLLLGRELAKEGGLLIDSKERKKDVDDQLKSEITGHEMKVQSICRKVNNGYEYRDIDCEEKHNFAQGVVTITRLDTGEMVKERAMTEDERQKDLDLEVDPVLEAETQG